MSQSAPGSPPQTNHPADELPPVEPPSAKFLLQLFVVPGLIVMIIVMVWFMFGWLATKGTDPTKLIAGLRSPTAGRWQAAMELASAMRGDRYPKLKYDAASAAELADVLATEVEGGGTDENAVLLQVFLARALGEFQVEAGAEQLLAAAKEAEDADVRLAAIEALAIRAQHAQEDATDDFTWDDATTRSLLALSRDSEELVRSRTAMALGVIGSDAAIQRLQQMVDDPYVDARYNAATGLARYGDAAVIETLIEMLDWKQEEVLNVEEETSYRELKRELVLKAGLDASRLLAQQNQSDDLTPLLGAVTRLENARGEKELKNLAFLLDHAKATRLAMEQAIAARDERSE